MNKHNIIRVALEGLSLTGAAHWLPGAAEAAGFVVTLHHVRPARAQAFDPNALLAVTPDFLDRFIARFKERGWRFVSVDDLVKQDNAADPRRIAITLDDGYRDNLEHAWPVFLKHGAPFTIFVCPGFAERTSELWWIALERIIGAAEELALPGDAPTEMRSTRTPAEKQQMFKLWTEWLTSVAGETRQRVEISALAETHGLDLVKLADELTMDWDEIRRIAGDPLCAIGAHTMTHAALARLPMDAAFREIDESVQAIAAETGRRPTSLAFPYGYRSAAGPREAMLAERVGLTSSFTTSPGFVPRSGSRHGLPRVSINGLFQQLRFLEVLLTPGLWTLRDKIRAAA
jgi:peptidoglycan/xylan/chitin deacetylase (PgdA/CDA1 family)